MFAGIIELCIMLGTYICAFNSFMWIPTWSNLSVGLSQQYPIPCPHCHHCAQYYCGHLSIIWYVHSICQALWYIYMVPGSHCLDIITYPQCACSQHTLLLHVEIMGNFMATDVEWEAKLAEEGYFLTLEWWNPWYCAWINKKKSEMKHNDQYLCECK